MTQSKRQAWIDWDGVRLVVFDVDGTLYRQRPLRMKIARDLAAYTIRNRDLKVVSVLTKYRRIREQMGDEQIVDFDQLLVAKTAAASVCSEEFVRAVVSEWMEVRPLSYLARCLYPKVPELFEGLRSRGKIIGVLSDYPAKAKLAAMGLTANHVVSAGDEGVGVLKPHARGLELLMAAGKATADETIVIGDRVDRDGLVAKWVGARVLIRSSKPVSGYQTFQRYDDEVFAPLLSR
jgi:FMN phosphatase YigB (HAD superfamily)